MTAARLHTRGNEDLHALVADLTNPTRENTTEAGWRTIPSLWAQLLDATGRAGGEGSSVARSRPPIATGVLSLVTEVESATATFLAMRKRPLHYRRQVLPPNPRHCTCTPPSEPCENPPLLATTRDVPADLRAVINDPGMTGAHHDEWAQYLTRWIATARITLEGTGPVAWLRSIACVDCGERTHRQWIGGEWIITPALQLVWVRTESGVDMLHHVRCVACHRERWPADLHLIAANNTATNLTQETLTS